MNVLETVRPDRGYRHVVASFCRATPWTVAGMNEHGLAIAMTGIPGPTLDQPGLPEALALRAVLPQCANVGEALDWLGTFTINWYGVSVLLGDAKGALALVEKNGVGMARLTEQDEVFVHTNHILDPDLAARSPAQAEPFLTNGRHRFANAHAQLKTLPRTEEGMQATLQQPKAPTAPSGSQAKTACTPISPSCWCQPRSGSQSGRVARTMPLAAWWTLPRRFA